MITVKYVDYSYKKQTFLHNTKHVHREGNGNENPQKEYWDAFLWQENSG